MSTLNNAVEFLVNNYGSLDAAAQRLPVDAHEVAEALADCDPDTAEFVALTYLSKYNPKGLTQTNQTTQIVEE
jgi:hypothetical protein